MKVNESVMLALLDSSRDVLLVEPQYRRKYIPLGLAKIATYIKSRGGRVTFNRKTSRWATTLGKVKPDLVCVTTLFTWDSQIIVDEVNRLRMVYPGVPVLVGGIYASLMPGNLEERTSPGVYVFSGYSRVLDQCVPDYAMEWGLEPEWATTSVTFTSRGCPNRCAYCAVHRLEAEQWVNPRWADLIVRSKRDAMIFDNNLTSFPFAHVEAVLRLLHDRRKRVLMENGVDCKHITDDVAHLLGRVTYRPSGLRMAFDRIEEDGIFQDSVRRLLAAGVHRSSIQSFVLFNFNDTPRDADYRMRECVKLGIHPYPQQFSTLNCSTREKPYIGPKWTLRLARAFRYFWLMAGYYTKGEFEDWAKGEKAAHLKLTTEDWVAWSGEKGKAAGGQDEQGEGTGTGTGAEAGCGGDTEDG